MKDYLVTPGPQFAVGNGAPALPMSVVRVDPDKDRSAAAHIGTGRLIELHPRELVLDGVADEDLAPLVAEATVPAVLGAVGDDVELAKRVVTAERAGKDRKSITEPLAAKFPEQETSA